MERPGKDGWRRLLQRHEEPVAILFDYLDVGHLEEFYLGCPDVTPEMVHAVIEASKELLEAFPLKKSA